MLNIDELFFFELGWFLLFFVILIWGMHRMMQRKMVKVREAISLKLTSLGFFINEEGFDHNLGLYAFIFKEQGMTPQHIYSSLPWSTIKSLFLSDEIMIIEDIYPFLTVREHKISKSQWFVDLLTAPPLKGFVNGLLRVLHAICFWVPRLNDALWRAIKRDPNALTKEIKVLESDIPEEALEYLYRVEYEERVLDPETEKYVTPEHVESLNMEEIEDLTDNNSIKVKQVEPLYFIIIKEEDEEKTERKLLQPVQLAELKLRKDVKISKMEPAYEVDFFVRNPPDSGHGIFDKLEVQQLKDDQGLEVKTIAALKTVTYQINPSKKQKVTETKTETLNEERIGEMKAAKAEFRIITVTDGPQFVTFTYTIKKSQREANMTRREIEELKKNPRVKILNVDEVLQAKRIKSFKNNPEEAVNVHITSCNAIAVQKMKTRQIASEKEKMQHRLQDLQEELYFSNAEFAKKGTEHYQKAVKVFQNMDLVLDNVLGNVFKHQLSGMTIDEIKEIAYRDFRLYMTVMKEEQTAKQSEEELTAMKEKIKTLEQSQKISDSKLRLEKELEDQFGGKVEQ